MKILSGLLLATSLLSAPQANACSDILPTKNVVTQAEVVFAGTVTRVAVRKPESNDDENPQMLHISLNKAYKGSPKKFTQIKTRFCNVPHWRAGAEVLVIRFPGQQYYVVKNQPLLDR